MEVEEEGTPPFFLFCERMTMDVSRVLMFLSHKIIHWRGRGLEDTQKEEKTIKISYSIHLSAKRTAMNLVLIDCSFNPFSTFCRKGHNTPLCRGSTLTNKTQQNWAAHTESPKQTLMLKGSLCLLIDRLTFPKGN